MADGKDIFLVSSVLLLTRTTKKPLDRLTRRTRPLNPKKEEDRQAGRQTDGRTDGYGKERKKAFCLLSLHRHTHARHVVYIYIYSTKYVYVRIRT